MQECLQGSCRWKGNNLEGIGKEVCPLRLKRLSIRILASIVLKPFSRNDLRNLLFSALLHVPEEGRGEGALSRQRNNALKELLLKPGNVCCAKERLDCLGGAVVH